MLGACPCPACALMPAASWRFTGASHMCASSNVLFSPSTSLSTVLTSPTPRWQRERISCSEAGNCCYQGWQAGQIRAPVGMAVIYQLQPRVAC